MKIIFWVLKYSATIGLWYAIDDPLAAHFGRPEIGSVPFELVAALVVLGSLVSEQYSVMTVRDGSR